MNNELITRWLIRQTRISYKFYYEQLSYTEKYLYKYMLYYFACLRSDFEIKISTTSTEINRAYKYCILDNPTYFFIKSLSFRIKSESVYIEPEFSYTSVEIFDIINQIDLALEKLSRYSVGKSYIEKELLVHNCIVRQVKYNKSDQYPVHLAHSIFVHQAAVCDGISKAAKIMFNYLGIKAFVVVGKSIQDNIENSDSCGHAWNMVEYDNSFYHIDITFDNNLTDNKQKICYDYFNLNDRQIIKDHIFDNDLIKSGDDFVDYYSINNLCFSCMSELEVFFAKHLNSSIKTICFRFDGEENTDKVKQMIKNVITKSNFVGSYSFSFNNEHNIFHYYF